MVEITREMYNIYVTTNNFKEFKQQCKERFITVTKKEYDECARMYNIFNKKEG